MTILEQILAGLQQKFAGVDTAILTRIATKKAEGITDETKVNSIIEGISFSDVLNSIIKLCNIVYEKFCPDVGSFPFL